MVATALSLSGHRHVTTQKPELPQIGSFQLQARQTIFWRKYLGFLRDLNCYNSSNGRHPCPSIQFEVFQITSARTLQ